MITRNRARRIRTAALVLLSFGLMGQEAVAQDQKDPPAKKKKVQDRVADLETAVERIDGKVNDVVGADDPEKIRERQKELEEKLDELAAQLDGLRAAAEEVAAADEERDARMDALAEETSDAWQEVEASKTAIEDMKKNPTVGYDKGFFLASPDGKHRLVITGFMKPYYQGTFQKNWKTDPDGSLFHDEVTRSPVGGDTELTDSEFGLSATRLTFDAQVFSYALFKLEIDYGNNSGTVQYPRNTDDPPEALGYGKVKINEYDLRALAAYGEFAPMPELTLRAGQFKVPFDKESLTGTGSLTFVSRSLMTRSYSRWGEVGVPVDSITYGYAYETQRASSFGYDRGFQIAGLIADGLFGYAAGVFNGGGPNVGNDNRDILVAARLTSAFLAKMSGKMPGGMSDLGTSKKPHLELGAAFAFDLPQHRDLIDPKYVYNSRDVNIAGDLHFKWMGASLLGGVFFRHSDHGAVLLDPSGEERPIKSFGAMVQAAYYNDFTGLEPAFRYSMYDADSERKNDHVHEITGGLNYYVFGNNLKLQVQYRGLFAADKTHSYMLPWGDPSVQDYWWFEDTHEITVGAQVGF